MISRFLSLGSFFTKNTAFKIFMNFFNYANILPIAINGLYWKFIGLRHYVGFSQIRSHMTLGKVKSSKHFLMQAKVFSATTSTPNDIMAAGEQALVDLYSGNPKEGLNPLLYKRFCE